MESRKAEGPTKRDIPFEVEDSKSNLLKFYRTPTRLTSRTLDPSISVIGETPFLMVPSSCSYSIFSLQSLTLQFLSTTFPRIDSILQSGVFVYVCCKDTVYKTYRGEVTSRFVLGPRTGSAAGTEEHVEPMEENTISEVVKFGSYFVICCGGRLVVCECHDDSDQESMETHDGGNAFLKELYQLDYPKRISKIFHPHTYLNKILIVFEDGAADLYNLSSRRSIFEFSFGSRVTCIGQTSVIDTIGLGMADGTIRIFNLKKNRLVFDIVDYRGKPVRKIDFKDHFLMAIAEDASIYDLNIKKEIYKKTLAFSGVMINSSMGLVTTSDSIEIVTLSDLKTLKSRRILNQDIRSILRASETEMLLASPSKVFKMCIYRDEASTFLKTSSPIDMVSVDTNILISGDGRLTYIDSECRLHSFLHVKCTFVKTFRDFCMIGKSSKILIMNLKSKRLVLKMEKKDVMDGDLSNETFTILTLSGIFTYNYASELQYQYDFGGEIEKDNAVGIRRIGNLYFLQRSRTVQIVSQALCREFEGTRYSVDPTARIMATVSEQNVFLYDIVSGNVLDCLKTNKTVVDVVILDSLKFVGILDSEGDVHLLSNISHFNAIRNSSAMAESIAASSIQVVKKESTFYKDLMMYKDFQCKADPDMVLKGLDESEVRELAQIIKKNASTDFFSTQHVLNKVLMLKGSLIDPDDLRAISGLVRQKFDEFEEKVLKAIGYLKLEQNKLL